MFVMKGKYNFAHIMIDSIDDSTKEQIQGFLNHPAFAKKRIAIMPDCLDEDTEVLTENGFQLIKNIKYSDTIANFNQKTKMIFFNYPKNIIIRKLKNNEKIYSLNSKKLNTSIVSTENHRNSYIPKLGIETKNIPNSTTLKDYYWGGSGLEKERICIYSDLFLQMLVWILGDGNIKITKNKKSINYRIRFGFKKERKIIRILELCNVLKIKPKIIKSLKQTEIYFNTIDSKQFIDVLGINKTMPKWFITLSHKKALIILDEIIKVDGDYENYLKYNTFTFNTKKEDEANIISAMISINLGSASKKTRIIKNSYIKENHILYKITYVHNESFIYQKTGLHNSIVIKEEIKYKKKFVVCLECDTGFFIARQNGRTFITGNCHKGSGSCIGFTMQLGDYILPQIVGVDIGCGMLAVNIGKIEIDPIKLDEFIKNNIPVGREINDKPFEPISDRWVTFDEVCKKTNNDKTRVLKAIGSLGSGNHFLECAKDSQNNSWIIIHSGSRNFGKRIADFYQSEAKKLMQKFFIVPETDMEFIPINEQIAQDYLIAMKMAQHYAHVNRWKMMNKIIEYLGFNIFDNSYKLQTIESVHNYIDFEDKIIRKGAISAHEYQLCIIPFNSAEGSAICKGKGNVEWNYSAPHGAGRLMSRTQAFNTLDYKEYQSRLSNNNVYSSTANSSTLDEAPMAYKSKDIILSNIEPTVEIIDILKPFYNFKASERRGSR
jgi:tRNA-splicing ligase RtcB (3'-phosphate/5'-hydroxy nucleic acid ligase)